MPRLVALLAAALLLACGQDETPPAPPTPEPEARAAKTPAAPSDGRRLLALRRYERLLNGRRAGTIEVRWTEVEHEGRTVVEDVTEFRSRIARLMGNVRDSFTSSTVVTTLRERTGELISMKEVVEEPGRTIRSTIRRTPEGYAYERHVGENRESFVVVTDRAAQVDAETLLGPKIREGEAGPGSTWALPQFSARRRAIVDHRLEVVGEDDEGPGLKVKDTFEGHTTLWWFAPDGSVVRIRAGNSVTRRDDSVRLDDLPRRAAAFHITLPADRRLPRIFTGRSMVVDVEVDVDETVQPPRIPPNPFTEVVRAQPHVVRLELKSHDDPAATVALPIDAKAHAQYLEATPMMEVDHPELKAAARQIVGDEKDARRAAVKIADHVFRSLRKGSPELMQPTALQIHRDPRGDCSEHALYFTALCRAAGIPARRCSGYVCIGSDWGGHAWCEIWLGKWIGADPTTNEIGTRARYIFLRRLDGPDGPSGAITAERTRIRVRAVEYADGSLDFEKGEIDPVVYSGIRTRARDGWTVRHNLSRATITGPGVHATLQIQPDDGQFRHVTPDRAEEMPGIAFVRFGPRPALMRSYGRGHSIYVALGREVLVIMVRTEKGIALPLDELADLLAPTLERDA